MTNIRLNVLSGFFWDAIQGGQPDRGSFNLCWDSMLSVGPCRYSVLWAVLNGPNFSSKLKEIGAKKFEA